MNALKLLFEDEFLVAIDKPPGMLVHPGRESEGNEWIAMKRLRDQLGRRVFPVHRLDRPTSGVLLFALDKRTAGAAQQLFERREVRKIYHAIVVGITPLDWVCETPLPAGKDEKALHARTAFRRLKITANAWRGNDASVSLSLVEASPTTGRFHQIRRHLLETGFPIVGDFRYAGMEESFAIGDLLGTGTRMLLHAHSLDFLHPRTGHRLMIQAHPDGDFTKVKWCDG